MDLLAGSTYLERGSPATLLYKDADGTLYIIDPGQGEDRPRRLKRDVEQLRPARVVAVLTHYHSDHLEALGRFAVDAVAAPARDAPMVRYPELRIYDTFGYPLPRDDSSLPFKTPAVSVSEEIPEGATAYGPLSVYPLPGHTEGHTGYMSRDGVLYVGDAVFGDRVIARYGFPYHRQPCRSLETLRRLGDLASRADRVVMSHGPLVKGGDVGPLVELNAQSLSRLEDLVRDLLSSPATLEEVTLGVLSKISIQELTVDVVMLLQETVKGFIGCMRERGEVEPLVGARGLMWKRVA